MPRSYPYSSTLSTPLTCLLNCLEVGTPLPDSSSPQSPLHNRTGNHLEEKCKFCYPIHRVPQTGHVTLILIKIHVQDNQKSKPEQQPQQWLLSPDWSPPSEHTLNRHGGAGAKEHAPASSWDVINKTGTLDTQPGAPCSYLLKVCVRNQVTQ